jgi:N,N-dimethylformamidase
MLPITGYSDRLSARPGETLAFKIDCRAADSFAARLVRVRCGDPNPEGPGIREIDLASVFSGRFPGVKRECHLGSYLRVNDPSPLDRLESFTLTALIWPTTPEKPGQGIIVREDAGRRKGFALLLDGAQGVRIALGGGAGAGVTIATGQALGARNWYRVWACYDAASGVLAVGQHLLADPDAAVTTRMAGAAQGLAGAPGAPLLIGARPGQPALGHYNGKIEAPRIIDAALGPEALAAPHLPPEANAIAAWDFSIDIPGLRAIDTGPFRLHADLVNLPARAMTGANWTGDEPCWRHAPGQYGAIHFHDDDIHDCGWQTDFTFTVPADLPSGVYAMRLSAGDAEEMIPFFVRPARGTTTSAVCVLIPTFTYVIYANHARGNTTDLYRARAAAWGARPWTADEHREYGLSTYNFHSDGSGICHASALRPMITFRSGFLSIPELPGSGLRHFAADTHLFDWLEEMGIAFDIVTDHDVHDEGYQALAPYRVVLTCTHPEYHTDRSYDAVATYTRRGGRLMYLGGNGFYWRIAMHRDTDGVLEIRRGEVGMRAWAAEPGEFFQAFDGNYGGLWRRVGKPPNHVIGIGFSSQGKFEAGHFRRRPGSHDPRAAWIFEGVADEVIGDFGLSGQGAAGYELDRADHRLGTPADAIVLATSENLPGSYVVVPEDLLSHVLTWNGEPVRDLIRADMVFLEHAGGGAVFGVGSITFCGSLSHAGYDNNVSRIVRNVLTRFRDAERLNPGSDPAPWAADQPDARGL